MNRICLNRTIAPHMKRRLAFPALLLAPRHLLQPQCLWLLARRHPRRPLQVGLKRARHLVTSVPRVLRLDPGPPVPLAVEARRLPLASPKSQYNP